MSTINETALLSKIVFSGKDEDYETWYRNFTSYLQLKGYEKELNGIVRLPAEIVDDGDDLPERDCMESMERSQYALLILVLSTSGGIGELVDQHTTLHEALQAITDKFVKLDTKTKKEVETEINNFWLEEYGDPEVYFVALVKLGKKLAKFGDDKFTHITKGNEQKMLHFLSHIPVTTIATKHTTKHYTIATWAVFLQSWDMAFDKTCPDLPDPTWEILKVKAIQYYKKLKNGSVPNTPAPELNEDGTILAAFEHGEGTDDRGKDDRFDGNCNWCGIYGHREDVCRKKMAYHGSGGYRGRGRGGHRGRGRGRGHGRGSARGRGRGRGRNGGTRHYTMIACWKCGGNHRKADCPHRHHHEESDYDRDDAAMLMFVGTLECEHEYLLINTAENERERIFPLVEKDDGIIKFVGDSGCSSNLVRQRELLHDFKPPHPAM